MENLRSSVRPVVTFGLVAAQAGIAVGWLWLGEIAKEPFAALAPFTMMAMVHWFDSRKKSER